MSSAAPALLVDKPRLITEGSLVVALDEGSPFPDADTRRRVQHRILKLVGLSESNLRNLTPNEKAKNPLRVLFQADGADHVTTEQAYMACEQARLLIPGSRAVPRQRRKKFFKNERYRISKRKSGTDH